MIVIIAGSRTFSDRALVRTVVQESGWRGHIQQIISGGARGIDTLAQRFAREQAIPLVVVPADWANITVPRAVIRSNARGPYNAATGMRRSEEMACIATQAAQLRTCAVGLILIWDGSSSGAAAMRQVAIHHQFLLFEYLPL